MNEYFWNANPCGGIWTNYKSYFEWIKHTEPYAFEIINHYDWAGKHVLDVGCGQGAVLNYLAQFGTTMFGIDLSFFSLQRSAMGAYELGYSGNVHLALGDAETLPIRNCCFDVVISFGVLHHTLNTQKGINEIWRVLKPGGLAIVMLYRTGNPKWWMTKVIRRISKLIDLISRKPNTIVRWLERCIKYENDVRGTALYELFGCPILKAYSNKQAQDMFNLFSEVFISNHQPGFRRMVDIIPLLRPFESYLSQFDQKVANLWGFYQVIEAKK